MLPPVICRTRSPSDPLLLSARICSDGSGACRSLSEDGIGDGLRRIRSSTFLGVSELVTMKSCAIARAAALAKYGSNEVLTEHDVNGPLGLGVDEHSRTSAGVLELIKIVVRRVPALYS